MARSAEKKMTALARWRAVYEDKISFRERPKLSSECNSLRDANTFRRQILNEITRKISQIQNSSLGEFILRDLNDEINRLFREKGHWEDRILVLGGTDHKTNSFLLMEKEGKALSGNWGYRYFGAAKDLPGVRELFQNESETVVKRTRIDLNGHYYGYQCEADGILAQIEAAAEKEYRQQLNKKLKKNKKPDDREPNIYEPVENPADLERDTLYEELQNRIITEICGPESVTDLESRVKRFTNISVPSQHDIEKVVVNLKKDSILKNYMSDDLIADMLNSGTLLGIEKATDSVEDHELEVDVDNC